MARSESSLTIAARNSARSSRSPLGSDCEPTLDEPSCPASCDGTVLNGTSYMACSEGAMFNDAEVLCLDPLLLAFRTSLQPS